MLKCINTSKIFAAGDVLTMALNAVTLEIEAGEYVAVMGPSGCGKSTLLSILGMLDVPDAGEYWFDGRNVSRWADSQLNELRRGRIGFIFQTFNLIEELTILENVELALEYASIPSAKRRERAHRALDELNVGHRASHFPSQLSGGQQQRVAVARALVTRPDVLLADEPTGNLDSAHGEEVMELLRKINDAGTTVVMVTHSSDHAARASRIIELADGAVQ